MLIKNPTPQAMLPNGGAITTVTGVQVPVPVISAEPDNPPARATTTVEENLHTASQRTVNMMWERTQRQLSLFVVIASMIDGLVITISNIMGWGGGQLQVPTIFSLGFGMIIGFYFGRTNHQTVGGVQLGR